MRCSSKCSVSEHTTAYPTIDNLSFLGVDAKFKCFFSFTGVSYDVCRRRHVAANTRDGDG